MMLRLLLIVFLCLVPGVVAAQCPVPRENGGRLSVTGKKLAQAHQAQVIAGGRLALAACAEVPGSGHVTPTPDFNVMLAESEGHALEFRTAGDCDTVLLLATEGGAWHFSDDDGDGQDARIRIEAAPAGRYDVWVGTYGRGSCRARLILQTFG